MSNINGALLRKYREGKGISIRALAEAAGVNKTTIQRIEKDEVSPSVDVLERILAAMSLRLTIESGH